MFRIVFRIPVSADVVQVCNVMRAVLLWLLKRGHLDLALLSFGIH